MLMSAKVIFFLGYGFSPSPPAAGMHLSDIKNYVKTFFVQYMSK